MKKVNLNDLIEHIELNQERLLSFLPKKLRLYFEKIELNERGILIYGPRGVGKTTFLLSRMPEDFLYFSADNPLISSVSLYELGNKAFLKGYRGIIVDEVHFINKWSQHVKALYDAFPNKSIWLSDSSSLILRVGSFDLSRRFLKIHVPLLSFREFVHLKSDITFPIIDPFNYKKGEISDIVKKYNVLKFFNDYTSQGTRPIFLEGNFQEKMKNILEKTLYNDLPFFLPTIKDSYLRLMSAVIGLLVSSKVPTLNVESMCKNWGVGKEKFYQLLELLRATDVVNIIRKPHDKKVYSKGEKIFMYDPSFYHVYNGELGNFREAYVAFALGEIEPVYTSPEERECDFIWKGKKIEVGGKHKKAKSSDYILSDELDFPVKNRVPLWMLGLMR